MTEDEKKTAEILKKHLVDGLEREIVKGEDGYENPKLEASLKKADIIIGRDDIKMTGMDKDDNLNLEMTIKKTELERLFEELTTSDKTEFTILVSLQENEIE